MYDKNGKIKGYINKYSGEEFGFPVIVGRKRNPYQKGWIMNSQEALIALAKDKDIKGETHRVLWFIAGILDFENWVLLSITEIGSELDLKQQSVSRAMKVLEQKEIIFRGPKVGRSYAFRLNPDFGWKGKVQNLEEYRKKRDLQIEKDLRKEQLDRSQKTIQSKKKDNAISKIIALLESENLDLDQIKEYIDQKEKQR